jgi:hypothetical protein
MTQDLREALEEQVDEYMYHGHILFDCPNPDPMERAYLNASPKEREEHWP